MRIILLTQNDSFFIHDAIIDLFKKLNKIKKHKIVHTYITPPSPFGKNKSFIQKSLKTLKIFGLNFFLHYSENIFLRSFIKNKRVFKIFSEK